jgi:circadian clock protein KaiC
MVTDRASTGIPGLDDLLHGGLIENRNALFRGPPGAGKTIFGLHFLSEGIDNGESSLFINLGEPDEYVRATAEAFDLDAPELTIHDLSPGQEQFAEEESYTLFESGAVDQPSFVREFRETIADVDPDRILVDPITEFRYLTSDERQFRKQIMGLLDLLKEADATVVLTSQVSETTFDDDLQFLSDTVITLEKTPQLRRIHVSKCRGSSFQRGVHSFEIGDHGVEVWPNLAPEPTDSERPNETISSGVPELDTLLRGGLEHGTVTFVSGPTGVGKTTMGLQFLKEAASQGKRSVIYLFEESKETLLHRAQAVNIPVEGSIDRGDLSVVEIPPEEYTVGQFGDTIRTAVEDANAEVILIDGVRGFQANLRGCDSDSTRNLLRIGRYLRYNDVTSIFTNEVHAITGDFRVTEAGLSNLADNILVLRHVEYKGEMRKVVGALKMRTSDFEHTLRELEITEYGISVGEPLTHLRGILTGTPDWESEESQLDN